MLKADGKVIMKKVKVASALGKAKGLMFEKKENHNYALVFKMATESKVGSSLHMMFVFFPIDVLFLNTEKEVVDKVTLRPWKINYTPKKAAKYVIELPQSFGDDIKLGSKISW